MTDRRPRRIAMAGVASLAALGFLAVAAAPASAADSGSWYLDAFHIPAAHDAGFTGDGVTIAVLDGSVDLSSPGLADADITAKKNSYCYDEAGVIISGVTTDGESALHATNIALYLAGNGAPIGGAATQKGVAPGAKLLMYSVVSPKTGDREVATQVECLTKGGKDSTTNLADAITDAVDDGADIITVSLSVKSSPEATAAVAYAIQHDVILLASLKNDVFLLNSGDFPADANGFIGVQAIDSDARVATSDLDGEEYENTSGYTDISGPGADLTGLLVGDTGLLDKVTLISGTSFATPITAGFISLVKEKYPDATTNQILQSLIRNTNGETHEPYWDRSAGYGVVSATTMLAADPSSYPDTNPFVIDDGVYQPELWQINGEKNPELVDPDQGIGTESQEKQSANNEKIADDFAKLAGAAAILIGAALLGGVVVLVVFIVRRGKKKAAAAAAAEDPVAADPAASPVEDQHAPNL